MKYTKHTFFLAGCFIFLALLMVISVTIGSVRLPISTIIDTVIGSANKNGIDYTIIIKLRIPRIVLAVVAGGILAVSGLIYQTALKTPIAEPYLLGVSSGASFGAALSVVISEFLQMGHLPYFPFALAGSLLTIGLIFLFSFSSNGNLYNLIFIGLSISLLFSAGLTLIFSVIGNRSHEIIQWLFGSLGKPLDQTTLFFLVIAFVIFIGGALFSSNILDIMYLPDDSVITTGINVKGIRLLFFIFSSFFTAYIVSLCGVIGFVGLIVPHIARHFLPGKHIFLILGSALIGSCTLLIADDVARTLMSMVSDYGGELPVGVVTSLIGAPFFIFLISSRRAV